MQTVDTQIIVGCNIWKEKSAWNPKATSYLIEYVAVPSDLGTALVNLKANSHLLSLEYAKG